MSPKLRDILCFSILLGSALVSSLELNAQQVHDLVNDNQKTEEQKIALAEEMVQSLPTEQKEKVLAAIKKLITDFRNGVRNTVDEILEYFKEKMDDLKTNKEEYGNKLKELTEMIKLPILGK